MKSINPFTLRLLVNFNELTDSQIISILDKVTSFFPTWKKNNYFEKSKLLFSLEKLLLEESDNLAKLATLEMGKPMKQARAEIEKCAWLCRYYAKHGEAFLQDERLESDASQSILTFEPIGAVLGVMPWNYPFWQVFRFAIPTLFAGNVCLLKHASNVPQCARAIEEIFLKAGFPKYVFTTLLINHKQVNLVLDQPIVQAISLTGSNRAGSIVSAEAASRIKKSVLELGGSDPFIVFEDADIKQAVQAAVHSRFQNNGQSCIAAKRFFIHQEIYDRFLLELLEATKQLKIGDPLQEETDIGPLAQQKFVQEIDRQVSESVQAGAKIVHGGISTGEHSQFYSPTIVEEVFPGMPVFDEEVFGPVVAIIKFTSINQVVTLANQSKFGLGASIWTRSKQLAQEVAKQLDTGTVAVNNFVQSDPRIPFGGVKESGFGRELGKEGILEFVNKKVIHFTDIDVD